MTGFAREYGDGLYALCLEEELTERVLMELSELLSCFRQEPDFLRLLSNAALPKSERVHILRETLDGQVHPYVLNFLSLLCERGGLSELTGCFDAYRENYDRDHQVVRAQVTTRVPLSESQRAALKEKLRQMTGKAVELRESLDPAVTGGVLLELDGKRYDGTVRARLRDLHDAITR